MRDRNDINATLYALFCSSYALAVAFAAHAADMAEGATEDAPISIRATELARDEVTVAPRKGGVS